MRKNDKTFVIEAPRRTFLPHGVLALGELTGSGALDKLVYESHEIGTGGRL